MTIMVWYVGIEKAIEQRLHLSPANRINAVIDTGAGNTSSDNTQRFELLQMARDRRLR